MTVPTDPFLFVNGTVADGSQVNARYAPLYAALSGALDTDNLLDTINELLGLTRGAVKRRGKSIIPTTESRTNVAYGTMPTPDQVTGIVLPTDGLIYVGYQATWQESVNAAAAASIFVGANQLQIAATNFTGPTVTQAALGTGAAAIDKPLASFPGGLRSSDGLAQTSVYSGDATTGQLVGVNLTGTATLPVGGPVAIFATAGTYTISVQFRSTSGSVTVKNRKLWVWTMGF